MAITPETGIYVYDGSEPDNPMVDTLNLLANSVSDAVATLRSESRLPNFRRFTVTRTSPPQGGSAPSSMTVTHSQSSPNAFGYTLETSVDAVSGANVANSQIVLPSGLYSVSFLCGFGSPANARSFIEMTPSFGVVPRNGVVVGEDQASVVHTFAATSSWTLRPRVYRQTVAASITATGELTVVRIGSTA